MPDSWNPLKVFGSLKSPHKKEAQKETERSGSLHSRCQSTATKTPKTAARSTPSPTPRSMRDRPSSRQMDPTNPHSTTTPTRRPQPAEPPPAYSPRDASNAAAVASTIAAPPSANDADTRYAFLSKFDTIFLIDDSGSMAGSLWRETAAALSAITPICTAYDADGIDVYFFNHRNPNATNLARGYTNITTPDMVEQIFRTVRPGGSTPTGQRLQDIMKPYLAELPDSIERSAHGHPSELKPLNIIVITDGAASDDPETVIVNAAKKLDGYNADPWQIGIQFFQVGKDPEAADDLEALDDALAKEHKVRDMVDTVPWRGSNGQAGLTAEGILKVVLGAVNRRLDRRRASAERAR